MTFVLPLLVAGILSGWALLTLVGGERTRRMNDIEAAKAAAAKPAPGTKDLTPGPKSATPPAKSAPPPKPAAAPPAKAAAPPPGKKADAKEKGDKAKPKKK